MLLMLLMLLVVLMLLVLLVVLMLLVVQKAVLAVTSGCNPPVFSPNFPIATFLIVEILL